MFAALPQQDAVNASAFDLRACPEVFVPENLSNSIPLARHNHSPHQSSFSHDGHGGFHAVALSDVDRDGVLEKTHCPPCDVCAHILERRAFLEREKLM